MGGRPIAKPVFVSPDLTHADIPCVEIGLDGKILYANEKFLAITGYNREKLEGADFGSLFLHPVSAADLAGKLATAVREKRNTLEYIEEFVITAEGPEKYLGFHFSYKPATADRQAGFFALAEDLAQSPRGSMAPTVFNECLFLLSAVTPFEVSLHSIARLISRRLSCGLAVIELLGPEGQIRTAEGTGFESYHLPSPAKDAIGAEAIRTGLPVVADGSAETRGNIPPMLAKKGFCILISVPISYGGDICGALTIGDTKPRRLPDTTKSFLMLAASFIANAVTRRNIEAELENHRKNLELMVAERTEELSAANELLEDTLVTTRAKHESLIRHESFFRGIVHDQTDLICRFGKDRKITFANNALSAAFGKTQTEIAGMAFDALFPAGLKDALDSLFIQLSPENPYLQHYSTTHKPGGPKHIRWFIRLLPAESGREADYIAVGSDITNELETSRANVMLSSIQNRLLVMANLEKASQECAGIINHYLDSCLCLIWTESADGIPVLSGIAGNGEYCRIAQESHISLFDPAIAGLAPSSYLPVEEKSAIPGNYPWPSNNMVSAVSFNATYDGNKLVGGVLVLLKKPVSPQFMYALEQTALQIGVGVRQWLVTSRLDVSERSLRQALQIGRMGVCTLDIVSQTISYSEELSAMLGLPDALKPLPFAVFLESVHPDDRTALENAVRQSISAKSRMEHSFKVQTGGGIRQMTATAELICDPGGRPLKLTGMMQDTTERVTLEHQLRESQKMQAVGTMAGGIAHDFKNILGPIILYSELAIGKIPRESEAVQYLREVIKASHTAKDLTQQILTFSRAGDMAKHPLLLYPVLKEALKLIHAFIPANVTLDADIDEISRYVMGNPTAITQVVMNLATNAVHAMKTTSGTLKTSLHEFSVKETIFGKICVVPPGEYLRMTISDTGTGMTPEVASKIFDPFFTTKPAGEGTGLGLAIVYGILKDLNVALDMETEPGKGTSFILYFPAIESADQSSSGDETVSAGGTGKRIIVAEDDTDYLSALKTALEDRGHAVTALQNPIEALDVFMKNPMGFDCALLDQSMPFMTGDEVAAQLLSANPALTVVLMSGYSNPFDAEWLKSRNIAAYLEKPFNIAKLEKILSVKTGG